jgi:hypothetical protein
MKRDGLRPGGGDMPKTSEMRESKFLKKEDVGDGLLLTVKGCDQYNVAKPGAEPEHKWCLTFQEEDKPLVLNATNIQLCEQMFQSGDTDDWVGQKIVLYTDPSIMYAGKIVGGVRVRAPRTVKAAMKAKTQKQAAPPPMDDDDMVPF